VIEGYRAPGEIVRIQRAGSGLMKPVHIRCCEGDASGAGRLITIYVDEAAESLCVELCRYVRIVCSRVTRELTVSGCLGVELVVGGSLPSTVLVSVTDSTILTGKDTWLSR